MDSTTYLNRYQLSTGENGSPVALHRGPSGVTFRAEDIETDQPVALKLMPTYSFELPELQQLETEARAAQQINHPNIARLYDFGFAGHDVVFVTELLDGTTLDVWVAEHGPLPAAAVLRIATQVVAGLAAAAFHSVIHRAIQPANLMIVPGQTPDGEWPFVKVLNFGGVPPTLSNSAVSFGQGGPSPQFAAPEQLEGKPADFRSELYSLGCTMWYLLTGAMPVAGAIDKGGKVPKAVRPLLAQLVALDPMQRPQDPLILQEQLAECLARVERRTPAERTFAEPIAPPVVPIPTPVVTAAGSEVVGRDDTTTPHNALLKPLALAAAVLLLAGIAALAFPYIRPRQTATESIGVPVGVPEASAASANSPAANSVAAESVQPTAAPSVAVAAADAAASTPAASTTSASPTAQAAPLNEHAPALVSVQSPPPVDTAADDTTAPPVKDGSAQQAAASTNNNTSSDAAQSEPPAPAGGPAQIAIAAATPAPADDESRNSTPSEPPQSASSSSVDSSSRREETSAASQSAGSGERSARVVKATRKHNERVARNEVRPAEPVSSDNVNLPPVPRGATRAKFLGTTPQGDLIFGLPSNERGYVDPPPAYAPDRRRARRARAVPDSTPAAPVLRAQPVQPDGSGE